GKSKGQFYTPAEVSRIMAQIIGIHDATTNNDTTVYDPTCGSGSLLLKVGDEASAKVTLYGQEKDAATSGLARMNMILHNNPTALIKQGNTLANPLFKTDDGQLKTFDYVVANPPFSDKRWSTGISGASVGKSYRYESSDGPLVFAGFLIRIRPDQQKLLPAYVAAYVTSGSYWSWVRVMSMRSGQPGINGVEYSQLKLPAPRRAGQKGAGGTGRRHAPSAQHAGAARAVQQPQEGAGSSASQPSKPGQPRARRFWGCRV
ncbi:MAG TPA: N-6 DNA methylase, partial [Polaromonas sp.]